jgi:hypothetical protein
MGQGQMEWVRDSREAQEVRDLLAQWEYKDVVVSWNPAVSAWEVGGKRFEDKDAAIASERHDGWQLFSVMEDGWVALPTAVEAPYAYESRGEAAVYHAFFQRRRH